MRRHRLTFLLLLAAVLLSSCNGRFGAIVPDFGEYDVNLSRLTVKASYRNSEGAYDGFHRLVDEFNRKNDYGITVELSNDEDCDLVITDPSTAAAMLRSGQSIELSPLIYHPVWGLESGRRFMFPAARKQTDYWDFARRITSIPLSMDAWVLLVNTASLLDAGYARVPSTWIMFNRALKKMSDNGPALGMKMSPGSIVSFIMARGGSVLKPIGFSYSIFNPVLNRSIRYLRNAAKKDRLFVETTSYSMQSGFAFGNIPLAYIPTDGIHRYSELISIVNPGMSWKAFLLPTKQPGRGSVINCTHTAVICDTSPEYELASWLFVKWMTEAEQQLTLAVQTGSLPVSRPVLSEILNENFDFFSPQWLEAARLVEGSKMQILPAVYDYGAVSAEIGAMVERIFEGEWVWLDALKLDFSIAKRRRTEPGR